MCILYKPAIQKLHVGCFINTSIKLIKSTVYSYELNAVFLLNLRKNVIKLNKIQNKAKA